MKTVLLITILGLACSACESRRSPAPLAYEPPSESSALVASPPAHMKPVKVQVRSLHRLMEVQVILASSVDHDTRFEYSTRWFDANGMLIPSFTGSWFQDEILGLGTAIILEMAPSPDAVTMNIECREIIRDKNGRGHSQPISLCVNSN